LEGVGDGEVLTGLAVCAALALALLVVVVLGTVIGPGPWLAR
jgi:hypothetical protein